VRIVFCGVGAVGSAAAVLCRNLEATLSFVDFDRVESKNVLAQAFVKQSIGKNKAAALQLQLRNLYGVKAEAFGVRLTEQNTDALLGQADLLVDGFDNAASRAVVSSYASRTGKALVHAALAADGTFGMVRWEERFTADEEDEQGQATCEGGEHLPLYTLTAATLARAIQDYLSDGTKNDYLISLRGVTLT